MNNKKNLQFRIGKKPEKSNFFQAELIVIDCVNGHCSNNNQPLGIDLIGLADSKTKNDIDWNWFCFWWQSTAKTPPFSVEISFFSI